jgi:hypothetical protein
MKISLQIIGKVFFFVLLASIAITGCKKKEEQQPEMAPPHGMMGQQHESKVVVPDSVKGKWQAVKIAVLDKTSQKKSEYEIAIGSEQAIPGSDLVIKVLNFLPDFNMNIAEHVITSSSNEPKKPAAQIMITEAGKEIFKGWIFSNLPSPHDFQHPKYAVSLAGFVPAGK